MNELFSVNATTIIHVSRLDGAFGLSIGNTYAVLSDSEAENFAEHILDTIHGASEPAPEPVDSTTEGENG